MRRRVAPATRRTSVMSTSQRQSTLETLDRHWAVKVVTPEDRAAAIQYGMGVLSRLCGGEYAELHLTEGEVLRAF